MREFALHYVKRLAIFLPIPAIFVLIAPVSVAAKIAGLMGLAVLMLIIQLVELGVAVGHEVRRDSEIETLSVPDDGSRRSRRLLDRQRLVRQQGARGPRATATRRLGPVPRP